MSVRSEARGGSRTHWLTPPPGQDDPVSLNREPLAGDEGEDRRRWTRVPDANPSELPVTRCHGADAARQTSLCVEEGLGEQHSGGGPNRRRHRSMLRWSESTNH